MSQAHLHVECDNDMKMNIEFSKLGPGSDSRPHNLSIYSRLICVSPMLVDCLHNGV